MYTGISPAQEPKLERSGARSKVNEQYTAFMQIMPNELLFDLVQVNLDHELCKFDLEPWCCGRLPRWVFDRYTKYTFRMATLCQAFLPLVCKTVRIQLKAAEQAREKALATLKEFEKREADLDWDHPDALLRFDVIILTIQEPHENLKQLENKVSTLERALDKLETLEIGFRAL